MYSARKPYLKLKMSVGEFFKSRAVFMKQLHMKFSEFEKPYLENEYNQMHLNIPTPDWGTWTPRALPPSSGFPRLPGYEPGRNNFGVPPERDKLPCTQDGCIVLEWPPFYVEPGELYRLHASIRAYAVVNVIIEGPVIFPNDCVGHVPPGWPLCGFYCGGWMQVSKDAEDGDVISITFVTVGGGSCRYTGEVEAACDPAAVIQYTTLQMAINEEQNLSASIPGQAYTWGLSGGGSLSTNEGDSTTYTAPSSNANCTNNATITLSCDEVVIDTIVIAINAWTGNDEAYEVWDYWYYRSACPNTYTYTKSDPPCTCEVDSGSCSVPTPDMCCPHFLGVRDSHYCNGNRRSRTQPCSAWETSCVTDCGECDNNCVIHVATVETCMANIGFTFGVPNDLRSQAMKDGGCCPEILL